LIQALVERRVGTAAYLEERSEIVVRADAGGSNQVGGTPQEFDFCRIAADRSDRREVVNRAEERRRG
jgi:hypothetical protein